MHAPGGIRFTGFATGGTAALPPDCGRPAARRRVFRSKNGANAGTGRVHVERAPTSGRWGRNCNPGAARKWRGRQRSRSGQHGQARTGVVGGAGSSTGPGVRRCGAVAGFVVTDVRRRRLQRRLTRPPNEAAILGSGCVVSAGGPRRARPAPDLSGTGDAGEPHGPVRRHSCALSGGRWRALGRSAPSFSLPSQRFRQVAYEAEPHRLVFELRRSDARAAYAGWGLRGAAELVQSARVARAY